MASWRVRFGQCAHCPLPLICHHSCHRVGATSGGPSAAVNWRGEREEDVEKAAKMINELLDVDNKEKVEEHKASQLRQLAIINGTLREEDFCHNCGEKGHKSWECPKRVDTFQQANVKCEICGDSSHITSDCPLRAKPTQVPLSICRSSFCACFYVVVVSPLLFRFLSNSMVACSYNFSSFSRCIFLY